MEINNVIKIETKWSEIFVYRYNDEGKKECINCTLDNYFYVKASDLADVVDILDAGNENGPFEYATEARGFMSIYNEKVIKIIPNKYHFYKCGKKLKEKGIETFEYSVEPYLKFLLENKINWCTYDEIRKAIIDIETDMCLDARNTPRAITAICLYDYATNKYLIWSWNPEKLNAVRG